MPSLSVSPATLTWTPTEASFRPERVSFGAASISWAGGAVAFGYGGTSLSVTRPELNRLTRFEQLTNPDGTPSVRLMAIWQEVMDKIEDAFAALTTQVGDNTTIIAQIQTALALAQAANDNAMEVSARTSLASSYTDPTNVLSATSDGTINIAAHERLYGDGTAASVNAGSVSGFASGAYVTVYYEDAGREGGAVAYQGTTAGVGQEGAIHIVGQVTIPAAGEAPASGSGTTAPGYNPPSDGSGSYQHR